MAPGGRRVVFLDRDGVLDDPVWDPADGKPESPLRAADVKLASGAAEGCRLLAGAGFELAIVSNQPAAAKGKASLEDLRGVHDRVLDLLRAEGARIGAWRYCFHHPDAVVLGLRALCSCRKPRPDMIIELARKHQYDLSCSWMVGDADSDVVAGRAAGVDTLLVDHPLSAHRRSNALAPAPRVVADLAAAAAFILQTDRLPWPTDA